MAFWWFEDHWWGFAVEIFVLIYSFAGLALVCDDYMVPALETLCVRWGVQEDVAGATFMAFGSAAPEIVISAVQTIKSRLNNPGNKPSSDHDDVALAIGTIIGSGMIAFTIIPATCAIFSDEVLSIKRRPFARDVGFYSFALFSAIFFLWDEKIDCYEAAILVGIYVCYVIIVVFGRRVRFQYLESFKGVITERKDSFVIRGRQKRKASRKEGKTNSYDSMKTPLLGHSKTVYGESSYTRLDSTESETACSPSENYVVYWSQDKMEIGGKTYQKEGDQGSVATNTVVSVQKSPQTVILMTTTIKETSISIGGESSSQNEEEESGCSLFSVLTSPLRFVFMITCPKTGEGDRWEWLYPIGFIISFAWISGFSLVVSEIVEEWVVRTGINETFFGLTLIAIGAEIPDTIQSVTVARRGYGSMAVANALGSQTVNICFGLGFSWLLGIVVSVGLKPVMLTVRGLRNVFNAAVCQGGAVLFSLLLWLGPLICSCFKQQKLHLGKKNGYILLFCYLATLVAFGTVEYLQHAF